ncbi:hypothetical protein AX16_004894 [Volvariella volvacea WC 439]|nr:hypothetical protein AX16_004894 [Volvariella volvacea WC 439]
MAGAAPQSSDSEASGSRVKVKLEKVKQEKVKQEKGRVDKGKQRAQEDDSEDEGNPYEDEEEEVDEEPRNAVNEEEGEEDEGEDDDEVGSPHGNKRARVNGDGDSRPTAGLAVKVRLRTLPRDTDGFLPGSIVRMQLKNFVTYDYVQFRPGPYLNMIVGPNGTGKSSIACAIAIGLNWPPNILGRATELRHYVKFDSQSGYIEIELKGRHGKPNLIIRRTLNASSNSSNFTLNGQSATGKEIAAKMADLNVQVGNLCSFLPQDKVSEFASMSPQQLLRETERAAGDEKLTFWHDTLIASGKEFKELQDNIKTIEKEKAQKQLRNDGIENEVLRYNERKKIEHEIALLELLIPVEAYRKMHKQYLALKVKQRALHSKVNKLKEKNRPAHDLLAKMSQQLKEREKARDASKIATQEKFKRMQDKWKQNDDLASKADDLSERLEQLKTQEKDRARKIKNHENEIKKLEEDLAKPLEVEDMDALNAEARKLNTERGELTTRRGSVEDKLRANADRKAPLLLRVTNGQNELRRYDDIENVKLKNLEQIDRDTHDAVIWLRKNKDKFRMPILEPPILSVTVPNERFADTIEGCFNFVQLKTFVAQCQEDLDTLNHYINDTNALGRKTQISSWYRVPTDIVPPPMTEEEMQNLGFDGYALNFIAYPQEMYNYLTKELNLHRTAVCFSGRVDTNAAMQAISRVIPGLPSGGTFINGRVINTVTRSKYGKRAVGNITRDLRPARIFATSTVDPNVVARVNQVIQEAQQELALLQEEREQLDSEHNVLVQEDRKFVTKQDQLKKRKDAVQRAISDRAKMQSRLTRVQAALKTELNAPSVDEERAKLRRELLAVAKKRADISRSYVKLARAVIDEQAEATRVGLDHLQIQANKAALEDLCNRKDDKFQKAIEEFNRVNDEFEEVKTKSKALLDSTRTLIRNAPEDIREAYQAIEGPRSEYEQRLTTAEKNGTTPPSTEGIDTRTVEELETELDNLKARLELNTSSNAGIVEQYEKRKQEIEELAQQIENKTAKAEKLERTITKTRGLWQPALERLVSSIGEKFSAAFDRIGCAGEIRISENEDYEKWAIDILVKFRDSEKLQLLTGQRQSGGERSLTTILYLMSLTEEARTPFSLVDEINQGMDQRAERNVHNNMVEVTCKPDSAQYFLITPKLLPDLRYHERMKILCVNNGEWLPEENNIGNMMNMIEGFVKKNRPPSAL